MVKQSQLQAQLPNEASTSGSGSILPCGGRWSCHLGVIDDCRKLSVFTPEGMMVGRCHTICKCI